MEIFRPSLLRPEADKEASAVKQIAARWKLPFLIESADVRGHAQAEGLAIEEAARLLRYGFLFAQARRLQAQAVAVGHTADDQVETVLMHMIRGAGLAGLKGMSYRSLLSTFDAEIPIVRPLLGVWREETVAYCSANGLSPHYDPSNDSLDFLRNRLRHILIPTLETYNPKFRDALWRTSQALAADYAVLAGALDSEWQKSLIQRHADYIMLDLSYLASCAVGIQRHLIRRAAEGLLPGHETTYAAMERASDFVADAARTRADLGGGLSLFREGRTLYVARAGTELPFDRWPQMPAQKDAMQVEWPGQVELSGGWKFSAEKWRLPALAWEQANQNSDPFQVWLGAEGLPDQLELRVRVDGDIFTPLGLKGHTQKLSDFFTNEKLPQRARARWPLLCAGNQIIWVPGYRPAESFKLEKSSRSVVYFSVVRPAELHSD